MKIYKLDIDVSKPTKQIMQMQQNATGLLSANVTNGGNYIRNLSCTLYDGANEIEATTSADTSFGFKVDVGAEPKYVKVVAKSTLLTSTKEYIASYTAFNRTMNVQLTKLVLPVGTYNQDEFLPLLSQVPANSYFQTVWAKHSGSANIDRIVFTTSNPRQQIWFFNQTEERHLEPDEPIIVTEEITFKGLKVIKGKNPVLSSETYPAIGYYTDYQLDTLVKPSDNTPYDGNYVEPVKEIEVDGVKFVPTTLSVDGVEYKVLAEAQPAPEPEPEPEPTEPETNDGE